MHAKAHGGESPKRPRIAGRWWQRALSAVGLQGLARDTGRWAVFARIAGHNYKRSQLTRMAAALSFRTLFGLLPVLVVGLVVLHSFVDEAALRGVVTNVLDFSGISKISVSAGEALPEKGMGAPAELSLFGPPVPTEILAAAQEEAGAQRAEQEARLDEHISGLLSRIDRINFGAVGLVGVVLLIYAALAMIVEVEKSFNQIAGDAPGKNWVRRVRDYWALLTLGPLLLVMSFGVREGAQGIAQRWAQQSREVAPNAPEASATVHASLQASKSLTTGWRGTVVSSVAFLSTVCISALALVIAFTAIPNARVAVVPALAGAFLSAVLWETSKWAFTAYAGRSYSRLYGAVALLPLFMLWVYVTWIIVLLGFQVTSTLQTFRSVSRKDVQQSLLIALGLAPDPHEQRPVGGVRIVDPAAVLLIMCVVAQRFVLGRTTTRGHIQRTTGLPGDVVGALVSGLVEMRMLLRVLPGTLVSASLDDEDKRDAGQPEGEAFALARPAEQIPAVEVLRVGDALSAKGGTSTGTVLDALIQAKARALEGRSLADIGALLRGAPLPAIATAEHA